MIYVQIKSNLKINQTYSQEMENFVKKHDDRIIEVEQVSHPNKSISYKALGLDYWHFTPFMIENIIEKTIFKNQISKTTVEYKNELYNCERRIGGRVYVIKNLTLNCLIENIKCSDENFIYSAIR